jgi:hypothetical protein
MAPSSQFICVLVLAGCALLCTRCVSAAARRDPLAALLTGGLTGLACVSLAMVYASPGW